MDGVGRRCERGWCCERRIGGLGVGQFRPHICTISSREHSVDRSFEQSSIIYAFVSHCSTAGLRLALHSGWHVLTVPAPAQPNTGPPEG